MDGNSLNRQRPIELVCPAGSLPALRAAVDAGADWVYLGFRDETNARNFEGLNFSLADAREGIRYAHSQGAKVVLAVNTYAQSAGASRWQGALDSAAESSFDAVILADASLMAYAARRYPAMVLHLSVQASATNYEAINFYHEHFGVRRAILPRVLSVQQITELIRNTPVEIEVFGFGSLCVMVEGRCTLSAYVTGASPNTCGVCSPATSVRWREGPTGLESRLNGVLVNRFAAQEKAAYPTLCKGRYIVGDQTYYAIEEPASLNALELLPQLMRIGVAAIKIEGRQRNASYVSLVTRLWRNAIDRCVSAPENYNVPAQTARALRELSEGQEQTLGAYYRPWK